MLLRDLETAARLFAVAYAIAFVEGHRESGAIFDGLTLLADDPLEMLVGTRWRTSRGSGAILPNEPADVVGIERTEGGAVRVHLETRNGAGMTSCTLRALVAGWEALGVVAHQGNAEPARAAGGG